MQGRGRLGVLQERGGQAAQGRKRRHQPRIGDRAGLDLHQAPGTARLEDDAGHVALLVVAAGVQRHPPARSRGGGEGRRERGLQPLARQGGAHLVLLPGQIGPVGPVLQGAAAAGLEMRTERRDAVGAGPQHLDELSAPIFRLQTDVFARQGEGGEHRLAVGRPADAVALGADVKNLGLERVGDFQFGQGNDCAFPALPTNGPGRSEAHDGMNEYERRNQPAFRRRRLVSHHTAQEAV